MLLGERADFNSMERHFWRNPAASTYHAFGDGGEALPGMPDIQDMLTLGSEYHRGLATTRNQASQTPNNIPSLLRSADAPLITLQLVSDDLEPTVIPELVSSTLSTPAVKVAETESGYEPFNLIRNPNIEIRQYGRRKSKDPARKGEYEKVYHAWLTDENGKKRHISMLEAFSYENVNQPDKKPRKAKAAAKPQNQSVPTIQPAAQADTDDAEPVSAEPHPSADRRTVVNLAEVRAARQAAEALFNTPADARLADVWSTGPEAPVASVDTDMVDAANVATTPLKAAAAYIRATQAPRQPRKPSSPESLARQAMLFKYHQAEARKWTPEYKTHVIKRTAALGSAAVLGFFAYRMGIDIDAIRQSGGR